MDNGIGADLFPVFNEISIIAQLAGRAMERALPDGLSMAGFSVLNHFVRLNRREHPSRLAAAFQVTKGAMTNTLHRLESAQYVETIPDPDDGRAKLVAITPAGRAVHADAIARLVPLMEAVGATLSVDRLTALLPDLRALREYLDEARNPLDNL